MFVEALKGHLPVIGVYTDDAINCEAVLQHYAGETKTSQLTKTTKPKQYGTYLYWTWDVDLITPELYQTLRGTGQSVVVFLKEDTKNPLIFQAGVLPTPEPMMKKLIADVVENHEKWESEIYPALRGLSLKAAQEIMAYTFSRSGELSALEIRKSRAQVLGTHPGLSVEDTYYDFYEWPPKLKKWLDLNKPYYQNPHVHPKLLPRGVMVDGPPGVGKSMVAKAIAKELNVPLFRVDIATALDKWIGESEKKLAHILSMLDREAPCVVLIDEVEKVFKSGADGAVISRLMSQLLWWLSEHQTKVFVVMTTNDKTSIPPELYRTGRLNLVFTLNKLGWAEAKQFAAKVYYSVIGSQLPPSRVGFLWQAMAPVDGEFPLLAHAEIAEIVYDVIKQNKWDLTNAELVAKMSP